MLSLLKPTFSSDLIQRYVQLATQRSFNIRLIIESPSKTCNVSAALRTVECFGIQNVDFINALILQRNVNGNCVREPPVRQKPSCTLGHKALLNGPDKVRVTLSRHSDTIGFGASQWLTLRHFPTVQECIHDHKERGGVILASDLSDDSLPLEQHLSVLDKSKPLTLVFGNEANGISKEMRHLSNGRFILPLKGFLQSLNVSATIACCLEHLRISGWLQDEKINKEEREALAVCWLAARYGEARMILTKNGIDVDSLVRNASPFACSFEDPQLGVDIVEQTADGPRITGKKLS